MNNQCPYCQDDLTGQSEALMRCQVCQNALNPDDISYLDKESTEVENDTRN